MREQRSTPPRISPALLELHEQARARGENPMITPVISDGKTPGPADAGLTIMLPPWSANYQPELDPEYQARLQEEQAQLESAEPPPKPDPPAPKQSRCHK